MKAKYIFTSLLLSSITITGCQDMDTFPEGDTVTSNKKDEVVESNPDRAEAGVNSIFAKFSQFMPNKTALNAERHNDIGYPTIMLCTDSNGNDVISDDNGYNWTGFDLNYEDRIYTINECQMVWNNLFGIIYTTNNVTASISSDTKDPLEQKFVGQALAARAFSYWVLAQLYQFNYVGHESSPCVPIITEKNIEEVTLNGCKRSSVQEVYTQINSDINTAIELLTAAEEANETRADKRYISSGVAYGLRARINLTMQKWSEAASDATKAIELSEAEGIEAGNTDQVGKPTFWSMDEINWMWGIKISETDEVATSGIINWISHMGSLNYGYANYSKGRQINKKLYATIPETDIRKGWWLNEKGISKNLNSDQQSWMKRYKAYTQCKFAPYNDVIGQSVNANDIPLMRIEEMYLIKAEGEAMSGQSGKSTLENFIKTYRDPEYKCTASSADDIQEEIFRQRRIELWGEGMNWFDIMRLNKGIDRRGCGYPNATMIFNIPAGDGILLWRIPEAEIQANKALSDNDNNPSTPTPNPVPDEK